jgi:hypothetical protein
MVSNGDGWDGAGAERWEGSVAGSLDRVNKIFLEEGRH